MDQIINQISTGKPLPLPANHLEMVTSYCFEAIKFGSLQVLGGMPDLLRQDWLNASLPEAERATRHISVEPLKWIEAMENQFYPLIHCFLDYTGRPRDIAILIWRGALASLFVVGRSGIEICHIDVKRNASKGLRATSAMFFTEADIANLCRYKHTRLLLPDPMLATGTSFAYTINALLGFGIPASKITILCVVAAPEGVFRLLKSYPGLKIITITLDSHLNSNAFIMPGLGDAGDKYFCGNFLDRFVLFQHHFNDAQWERLGSLLLQANNVAT